MAVGLKVVLAVGLVAWAGALKWPVGMAGDLATRAVLRKLARVAPPGTANMGGRHPGRGGRKGQQDRTLSACAPLPAEGMRVGCVWAVSKRPGGV
jgi:hypothetical protein